MDYFGIIKKAFRISIDNRFLWIFGILAGSAGGMQGLNLSMPSNTLSNEDTGKIEQAINAINPDTFWNQYGGLILGVTIGLFLLMLIIGVLNIISQGALVGSVGRIAQEEKMHFFSSFKIGWHHFWRILGLGILYFLMGFGALLILVLPIIFLAIGKIYVLAIIWGVLFFFLCLLFWILIGIVSPYSLRMLVVDNKKITESISGAFHLFRKRIGSILIIYLLIIAIGIVYGIGIMLALLIVGGIFTAITVGLWLIAQIAGIIFGAIVAMVLIAAVIIVSGTYNTFISSILTLMYLSLTSKDPKVEKALTA